MIGEKIKIKDEHLRSAKDLLEEIGSSYKEERRPVIIGIGGESGSGKSTQALAIQISLNQKGVKSIIFHMDDYFKIPPKSNHQNRLSDISAVGPQEVLLEVLDDHLATIKKGTQKTLDKPLVDYDNNVINREQVDTTNVEIIIVEGTYVLSLKNIDIRVFLPRSYHETRTDRLLRARDEMSSFNEKVLEIEHQIIREHEHLADYIIDNNCHVVAHIKN